MSGLPCFVVFYYFNCFFLALKGCALKAGGTVLAVGNNDGGQLDVNEWRDIVAISTGNSNTIGLMSDGTVVSVGNNSSGQLNVEERRDII